MDFISILLGRELSSGDELQARRAACRPHGRAAFDSVVIGQPQGGQIVPTRLGDQPLRRPGAIGKVGMQVQVRKHTSLFHLARGTQQFAPHFVQDAVHKFAAVLRGELLRDIDGFIDAHHWGDIVAMKHLVN